MKLMLHLPPKNSNVYFRKKKLIKNFIKSICIFSYDAWQAALKSASLYTFIKSEVRNWPWKVTKRNLKIICGSGEMKRNSSIMVFFYTIYFNPLWGYTKFEYLTKKNNVTNFEKEKWTNKGNDKHEDACCFSYNAQYNKSYPMFV